MKLIYKVFTSLAVLASVTACDLDLKPTNSDTYEDLTEVFDTYEKARQFSEGLAVYFRAVQNGIYTTMPEIQGDMFNAVLGFGNNGGAIHTMGDSFTEGDQDVEAIWNGYYALVTQANTVIVNIENVDVAELSAAEVTNLNQWKGQAIFFRAYAYHQLAQFFAVDYEPSTAAQALGLPIVLSPDVDAKPQRSSLEATYEQILRDISVAKSLMTTQGTVRSIYPTLDALSVLEARVNLHVHNYDVAYTVAIALVNSGRYPLSTSVEELNMELVDQNGTETILQSFASLSELPASNSYYMEVFGWLPNYGIQIQDYAYTTYYLPNQNAFDLYEEADIRTTSFFAEVAAVIDGGLSFQMFLTKYKGNPALSLNNYSETLVAPRAMGISEAYLIAAEAAYMDGNTSNAMLVLNALQSARGASETQATLEAIQDEWAKETIGEGLRIQCLKRWNIGFDGRQAALDSDGSIMTGPGYDQIVVPAGYYKLTWPIPTLELQTNTNLQGQQNPGWGI